MSAQAKFHVDMIIGLGCRGMGCGQLHFQIAHSFCRFVYFCACFIHLPSHKIAFCAKEILLLDAWDHAQSISYMA